MLIEVPTCGRSTRAHQCPLKDARTLNFVELVDRQFAPFFIPFSHFTLLLLDGGTICAVRMVAAIMAASS